VKTALLLAVSLLLVGCVTPKIGLGYDFINQRVTVSVEPGDGKRVVKPE
jgi:starvation-inducible outer membrane lipoprotein